MKRLTALLLALLALALPALAEPMALLDYTDDILEDGSPRSWRRSSDTCKAG